MRTIRLFSLLDRLRGRQRPISAESLAEALDVSVRTIYRDMSTLQSMGAPIRGESGLGYQLEKGYFLPPLHFDANELEAIMLGTRLIAARGDAQLSEAARRVSAKIGAMLGEDAGERYQHLPLRAVPRKSLENERATRHLGLLRAAIRGKTRLFVHYCDLKGNESRRKVRPLGLTMFDAVWLLTVWCEVKADFRNLRVDGIQSLTETGERFKPERGKRFEDYIKSLPDTGESPARSGHCR
ncbi:helix-turn-helix transcriptional regulator [Serratia entomophila]|uniref:helix-turn-helix transcriptional regulator n=1 Tax=Serratia entomophila TaxID=42906 RepID=UPI0021788D9D|nr:YafY family protein [Serratia entomophila]CAI1074159.1 HTH domain [Serratia entomophila]CAI1738308.1 HTH domain [Serratia entomophila]CAI1759066.1 HTH domain [Serratia entomophila]CAI1812690.1 HTH domain [Serratia entomophila]CAI1857584.1 HTH domain [Serratia entomophila]